MEDAYDDVIEAADADEPAGQDERTRDSLGRFVAKPGEQSQDPAPKPITETQPKAPEPAPQGSSTQVPDHWSAEFKADFLKLPPEGQSILLNRHREMEADYTRKSQASAGAVSFAQALEPVFSDQVIQKSLQEAGMNVVQAIHEWGGFHKRAMSPEVKDRVELLVDLTQRMGLDPARIFVALAGNRQGPELSPEDLNDPAIQYFANKLGETTSDLQAVRADIARMREAEVAARQEWVKEGYLAQINAFGEEKDAHGNLAHPYLDAVMEQLHELYSINPQRDLAEAYKLAVRMNDAVYQHTLEADRARSSGQDSAQRARQAMRGNTRGLTAPVAKPNSNANGSSGLRGVLESTADEIGL
jgi:hypothetical protein